MDDRRRWEERHARGEPLASPSRFVVDQLRRVREPDRRQRALDLACGGGRHARALARAGFSTIAVDASRSAVVRAAAAPAVLGVIADARHLPFRPRSFDLIVKTCFLDRSIIPALGELLVPGGHLLVETFRIAQHELTGHPRREFCLTDGELEELCRASEPPLALVASHETDPGPGGSPAALAGVLARRD
jgi:SAM-dependent methyltransferase